MDYDWNNSTHPFGPDGCFNVTHPANKGITDNLLGAPLVN